MGYRIHTVSIILRFHFLSGLVDQSFLEMLKRSNRPPIHFSRHVDVAEESVLEIGITIVGGENYEIFLNRKYYTQVQIENTTAKRIDVTGVFKDTPACNKERKMPMPFFSPVMLARETEVFSASLEN
jgi:hypothetical protein